MPSEKVDIAPTPGCCKGYYSAVEEVCTKMCVMADECEELTKDRLVREGRELNEDSKESVIPERIAKAYGSCVKYLKQRVKHDELDEGENRTVFVRKGVKCISVDIAPNRSGAYRVRIKTLKDWTVKAKLLVKSLTVLKKKEAVVLDAIRKGRKKLKNKKKGGKRKK